MTLALLGGPAAGQESQACGFGPAVHAAASSVVHVRSTFSMGEEPFGPDAGEVIFSNTGFFVGTGGEVLTSLVGLVGCRDIAVTASEGRTAPARLVALDQPSGLAVLKAELTGTVPLELVESPPAPGSWALLASARPHDGTVVAIMRPVVVHERRAPVLLHGVEWHGLAAVPVYVPIGSASAPILDRSGRLAAVVLGLQSEAGAWGVESECFALPADRLVPILARLMAGVSRRQGWLGLAILREPADREGVRVAGVLENSPAHEAGIRPGDVLLAIEGRPIEAPSTFTQRVAASEPGASMRLKVLRKEQIVAIQVEVGARPLLICDVSRGAHALRQHRAPETAPSLSSTAAWQEGALQELLREHQRLTRRVEELERQLGEQRPTNR